MLAFHRIFFTTKIFYQFQNVMSLISTLINIFKEKYSFSFVTDIRHKLHVWASDNTCLIAKGICHW